MSFKYIVVLIIYVWLFTSITPFHSKHIVVLDIHQAHAYHYGAVPVDLLHDGRHRTLRERWPTSLFQFLHVESKRGFPAIGLFKSHLVSSYLLRGFFSFDSTVKDDAFLSYLDNRCSGSEWS